MSVLQNVQLYIFIVQMMDLFLCHFNNLFFMWSNVHHKEWFLIFVLKPPNKIKNGPTILITLKIYEHKVGQVYKNHSITILYIHINRETQNKKIINKIFSISMIGTLNKYFAGIFSLYFHICKKKNNLIYNS